MQPRVWILSVARQLEDGVADVAADLCAHGVLARHCFPFSAANKMRHYYAVERTWSHLLESFILAPKASCPLQTSCCTHLKMCDLVAGVLPVVE